MRLALGIEYDGGSYHGWQKQPGLLTVQEQLETALSVVAAHPVSVACAGRTDTGVHALCQIVHFDTVSERSDRAWIMGTNANMPYSVTVRWIKEVADDFHARFSALSRRYRYVIYNSPLRPAIMRHGVTWHYRYLDADKMQQGADYLLGEHDFTSYRALGCQAKNPIRTLHRLSVSRHDDLIVVDVTANAFLHHMVRNIVGVLINIGTGYQEPVWAQEVLLAKDRTLGGITAPPYGLYFVEARYPEAYGIPRQVPGPFFIGDKED